MRPFLMSCVRTEPSSAVEVTPSDSATVRNSCAPAPKFGQRDDDHALARAEAF